MSEVAAVAVAELLPQRPPMVLLGTLVEHTPDHTVCTATIGADHLFLDSSSGHVPVWVGLEYMAQCIAAHAGLRARAKGKPPPIGFLIGARRIECHVDGFSPAQVLSVTVTHVWGDTDLGSFQCCLRDERTGELLAEGTLSVYVPADVSTFEARQSE